MSARLCILAAALAIIARAKVAMLPGWVVPLPALILTAELTACAALMAWLIARAHRDRPHPRTAPAAEPGAP
jgi:hypothetical protein